MDPPIKVDERYYHECSSIFTEYRLMREFVLFQEQNITNVYVVPSQSSAFVWFGVIFVHDQPYQGAILRFRVIIPADYPCHETPKVIFDRKPFHPLINPSTGTVCTMKHFETWDPNVNHVWQVIQLVKNMFKNLEEEIDQLSRLTGLIEDTDHKKDTKDGSDPGQKVKVADHPLSHHQSQLNHHFTEQISSQINLDAIKLYHEDFESFQFNVAEVVVESRSKIYDPPENEPNDEHQITFGPFNPEFHEDIRKNVLLTGKTVVEPNSNPTGNQAIFYVKGNQDVTIN